MLVHQRVNLYFPMVFLWFSHVFPYENLDFLIPPTTPAGQRGHSEAVARPQGIWRLRSGDGQRLRDPVMVGGVGKCPVLGILNITKTSIYLLVIIYDYISNSWVMWKIRTFTNPGKDVAEFLAVERVETWWKPWKNEGFHRFSSFKNMACNTKTPSKNLKKNVPELGV